MDEGSIPSISTKNVFNTVYLCICNEITEQDIKDNPELINLIGTECGKCISAGDALVSTWVEGGLESQQESCKNQTKTNRRYRS